MPILEALKTEGVEEYLTQHRMTKVVNTIEYFNYGHLTPQQFCRRMKCSKFRSLHGIGPVTGTAFRKLMTEFFQVDWPDERGGKREGAGRKRKNWKGHHFSLAEDVTKILALVADKTAYVEAAIRLKYRFDKRKQGVW